MTINPLNESHLALLLPVAKQSFIDAFEAQSDPENFKVYVANAFTEEAVLEELQHSKSVFFSLDTEGGEMTGYVKMRWDRSEEFFPNGEKAVELQRIYLLKEFWNQGLGKTLLDFSENYAREQGFEWIYLVVWLENQGAIRFYERYGWEKFARKNFKFGNEIHHDFVLRKKVF